MLKLWGTLSCPTLRAGSLPNILGLEIGRQFYPRDGKLPTFFFFEEWTVADTLFLPTKPIGTK